MTREEAIKIFNTVLFFGKCDAPKEELEECLKMAIKAMEQEPILDKIRAEIEELDEYYDNDYFSGNKDAMYKCNEVLQIIDKYKSESEG